MIPAPQASAQPHGLLLPASRSRPGGLSLLPLLLTEELLLICRPLRKLAALKIEHLQETAQTHHAALKALQQQAQELREGKEKAERALRDIRLRHSESEADVQLLEGKVKLYSGDGDVDIDDLERALTIVRRRHEDPVRLDFLEEAEGEALDNLPACRRKVQQLQLSNLDLTRELERAERMLKAQMSINRDLHLELESISQRTAQDKRQLQSKLADFEALALERLHKITRCEAQLKQLAYASKSRARRGDDDGSVADSDNALLDELAEGDFSADENIVEVWVVGAELEAGTLSKARANSSACKHISARPHSLPFFKCSFFVIDFFDSESQATPLLGGRTPNFDFASTFKASTLDELFLRYMGTESLILELNQTRAADFELLGRATVGLSELLGSRPKLVLPREPVVSVEDGTVIG
ncbi:unnamed protein product [Chrysoparadoxa australica]